MLAIFLYEGLSYSRTSLGSHPRKSYAPMHRNRCLRTILHQASKPEIDGIRSKQHALGLMSSRGVKSIAANTPGGDRNGPMNQSTNGRSTPARPGTIICTSEMTVGRPRRLKCIEFTCTKARCPADIETAVGGAGTARSTPARV